MTVNQKIIAAVSPIVDIEPVVYTGTKTTYAIFEFLPDEVIVSGDDDASLDLLSPRIHLFCPVSSDPEALRKSIRIALKKAGFTYPTITQTYESDTKLHHIIFDCEMLRASERE